MIRLFVMLGAIRIEFRKEGSKNKSNKVNASLQATSVRVSADAEVSSNSTSGSVNYDNRIIKLSGRRWEKDSKLDTSSFSWLPFEPSWESIVFAREHGGCISAELELKKKTAFSSSSEGKLGVDIEVFKTSVGVNTSSGDEEDVNYNVYVEFTEVIQ